MVTKDDSKKEPLVSFVVNCYNGEKYLKRCLNSILKQQYSNWELIFWDNASTDKSADIFKSYNDNRFKYFKSKKNVSLGQARAWAVDQCQGEYIAFLDVDDEWLPEKTKIQVNKMIDENSYLSYSGMFLEINDKVSSKSVPKYQSGYIFDKLLNRFEVNMPSSMIKKEALVNLNINFDPEIVASEEYDLFIQIAAVFKVSVIKDILCVYRISKKSLTNKSLKYRAHDKKITFAKLEKNYSKYILKFKRNYLKAKAKIWYYEFQYFYKLNDIKNAKKSLKKIWHVDYRYMLILLSLYISPHLYGIVLKMYDKRGLST